MPDFPRLSLLTICLAACAPPIQAAAPTAQAEALSFFPAAGKSRIYVYRSGGYGFMEILTIAVDSQVIGEAVPNSYLMVEVDPGAHLVSSPTDENESFVEVNAQPDSCYFMKVWPKMGVLSAHSAMGWMQPDSARRAIRKSRMAESSWPGVPIPRADTSQKIFSPIAQ
jgi:hypothetical protein